MGDVPSPSPEDFADGLAEIARLEDRSNRWIAAKAGLSEPIVRRLLGAQGSITIPNISAVLDVLGATWEDLLRTIREQRGETAPTDVRIPAHTSLPRVQRDQVATLLEALGDAQAQIQELEAEVLAWRASRGQEITEELIQGILDAMIEVESTAGEEARVWMTQLAEAIVRQALRRRQSGTTLHQNLGPTVRGKTG